MWGGICVGSRWVLKRIIYRFVVLTVFATCTESIMKTCWLVTLFNPISSSPSLPWCELSHRISSMRCSKPLIISKSGDSLWTVNVALAAHQTHHHLVFPYQATVVRLEWLSHNKEPVPVSFHLVSACWRLSEAAVMATDERKFLNVKLCDNAWGQRGKEWFREHRKKSLLPGC